MGGDLLEIGTVGVYHTDIAFVVLITTLISVKSRLEVKAIQRTTGKILAVTRETTVAVDLTEQIAGKTALQDAAARIAVRLLPKLVETSGGKKNKNRIR